MTVREGRFAINASVYRAVIALVYTKISTLGNTKNERTSRSYAAKNFSLHPLAQK